MMHPVMRLHMASFALAISSDSHAPAEATKDSLNAVTILETVGGGRGTGRVGTRKCATNRL